MFGKPFSKTVITVIVIAGCHFFEGFFEGFLSFIFMKSFRCKKRFLGILNYGIGKKCWEGRFVTCPAARMTIIKIINLPHWAGKQTCPPSISC